ncbi:MAG: hypothetical protein JSU94_15295 [Phycisphaerales bacterium]|nr:MAG: hypothetical protein JSU94_15295 [Phycisphaerales bacterium]
MRDAHWDTDNKPDPSSAIFDYCNTPYSQIISKGRDLTISPTRRNGADLTQVTVKHPHWNEASTLLFDEQMRLLERCVIKQLSTDPKPRTTEKHTFSEYQEQQLASGEKIWIPHKIEWRYYMGNLPDGTPVDFTADVLTIRRIDLNVHIPDDKFVIRFPAGTKIWDGLAGLGYIDEPAQRTIDQSISDLIGDKTADAQHSSGARPHSADANTEGRVIPASDVPRPLAADSPPTPTTRRWPFYALLLTLAVLVLSVLVRLRTKKRPT